MKETSIIQKELLDFIESNKLKIQEDLKRKTIVNPLTQCWEWQAYRNKKGYGNHVVFTKGKEFNKTFLAHRLSYMVFKENINDGITLILHNCDNPSCINPNHLRPGLNDENMAEMVLKDRQAKGEKVIQHKLTEEQVLQIRQEKGTTRKIGKKYHIDQHTVSVIKRRKSWTFI